MSLTSGQRGVIALLRMNGKPITRENYIALEYGDNVPDPWTAENEEMLPDFLQEGYDGDQPWLTPSPPST
jgi:hypothetical protein